ncbi:MAG: hypothetical protein JNJ60_18685 [Rhodocyclaceae bacterium]|nr:hypothetical protein [Rhodocyclaceae bacterium]
MSKIPSRLARRVTWRGTGNAITPYAADVDGLPWQLRINDFPAEPMYTLIVAGQEVEHFDDWPAAWRKPG